MVVTDLTISFLFVSVCMGHYGPKSSGTTIVQMKDNSYR